MNESTDRIVFRVASATRVGGGHVSRCLAVARALGDAVPALFVLDPGADAAAARCAEAGVEISFGPLDVASGVRACVLDGYEFTPTDIAYFASIAPLAVFDDFGSPPAGASLAINATPGLSGNCQGGVPALLGTRYAAIDARFAALAEWPPAAAVRNVLVTLGRTEAHAEARRALEALESARNHEFDPEVTLVLPGADTMPEGLRQIVERPSQRITVIESVSDMAAALAEVDLVVGAGGVSLLERMAAGVPSVSVVLADNQRAYIAGAAALGATRACELDDDSATGEDLEEAIWRVARDPDLRAEMVRAGRQAVDGLGANRIADALLGMAEFAGQWVGGIHDGRAGAALGSGQGKGE
ncbi:MAG: glycosyltransferase [Alphaproteobacteria bacterium]|jgi:spore coat polysaccharide biosynthesis predicted glycosyltransferase SpsG|nr:glycosyltransferase [Alphaproteobacteria bacterium]